MNKVSTLLMAAAAATLSASPAIAARANPAAPLSLSHNARAGTTVKGSSELAGGGGILLALAAGVAIIVAIIVAGSEGSKLPTSP